MTSPMNLDVSALAETVQTNCHIADAAYAGDYTLCVYLLKMREYYRWEMGLPLTARLPNDAVGNWLVEREALWDRLRDQAYQPLAIGEQEFGPFDTQLINDAIVPEGLVYSGGLGNNCRPHFFLGRLHRAQDHPEFKVLVAAEEFARDLTAPPAMSRDRTIFIRRESLRRMLWEKVEEWRWRRAEGAMERALAGYPFDTDEQAALEAMTDQELEAVILHEIGEVRAGELLGEQWHELLASLPYSQAELMARAVRDHLADCLSTLPGLLTHTPNSPSLHFYFANLRGMRQELFPALQSTYEHWVAQDDPEPLHELVQRGAEHWRGVAEEMVALFRTHGEDCQPHVEELGRARRL